MLQMAEARSRTSTATNTGRVPRRALGHRACDACYSRKVKCDGKPNCRQCMAFNLWCTYTPKTRQASQKRKAKGAILSKYSREESSPLPESLDFEGEQHQCCSNGHIYVIPRDPSLPVYNVAFFESLLPVYMEAIYPMFPIITLAELRQSISRIDDRTDAAFVYALAAVIIGYTGVRTRDAADQRAQVKYLSEQSLEFHGAIKPGTDIDLKMIMTDCLLSGSLFGTNDVSTAWLYLRQSITMASIIGLHETKTLMTLPLAERSRRQRLYWMLYIHERFLAIHYYRPVGMEPLDILPERDPDLSSTIQDGFMQLIKLFSLIDAKFINAYLDNSLMITENWLEEKQQQLTSATELDSLSDMQKVDVTITQQWLRMLVWQMAMRHLLLSSNISAGPMSLLFPVEVARKLRVLVTNRSREIQVHGVAILQKLFEIAMGISDVLTLIPAESIEENADRIEDFVWIVRFLLAQPSVTSVQKEALQKNLETILEAAGIPVTSPLSSTTIAVADVNNAVPSSSSPIGMQETPARRAMDTETQLDDPWLILYRSVAGGLNRNNETPEEPFVGPMSWIASLNDLSGASQELLHNLEYPLQS